ncbi:C40 family peptidase [Pseudoclavibacter soli]|uniref:C40 family peptidase n=1 Tax=Pseudoclavibacter soli TaxID=452623 RepID=UPI000A014B1C|nr:C40 family peptidase [Pseudoclavibacter soli]
MLKRTPAVKLSSTFATVLVSGALVFATAVPSQAAEVEQAVQTGYSAQELHAGASAVNVAGSGSVGAETPVVEVPVTTTTTSNSSSTRAASSTTSNAAIAVVDGTGAGAQGIVATGLAYVGVPYVWGGASPSGWDCSGFVQWVYAQNGIQLPRTSGAQGAAGTRTTTPVPGDLVVYGSSHIGIYIGNGMMVHASKPGVGTVVAPVYGTPYYSHIG